MPINREKDECPNEGKKIAALVREDTLKVIFDTLHNFQWRHREDENKENNSCLALRNAGLRVYVHRGLADALR